MCEEEVNSSTHRSGVSIRTDLLMEYEVDSGSDRVLHLPVPQLLI